MDSIVDFLLNYDAWTVYLMVFGVLLLCGFGLPIPEDITLVAGGIMTYYGLCDLNTMIAVGFVGVMLGDSVMWFLGHKFGRKLTKRWIFQKLLPEERLQAASRKFKEKKGNRILFLARFMPGLRAPMFFSAGLLHVPFRAFFFWDGLAALLSVPAIIAGVFYFGDSIDHFIRMMKRVEYAIIVVAVCIFIYIGFKWWRSSRMKAEASKA